MTQDIGMLIIYDSYSDWGSRISWVDISIVDGKYYIKTSLLKERGYMTLLDTENPYYKNTVKFYEENKNKELDDIKDMDVMMDFSKVNPFMKTPRKMTISFVSK